MTFEAVMESTNSMFGIANSLIVLSLIYTIGLVIHRLYLSPISSFPGPRLAAATFWYEFYYDVILGGQYVFRIKELHKKYGPIVRISPQELHVCDAEFIDVLYASNPERRDKWSMYTQQFGTAGSMIATEAHEQHRQRRAALARFFSTSSVRRMQPPMNEKLDKLMNRLSETTTKVNVEHAISAFTADFICEYACGHREDSLSQADWNVDFHRGMIEGGKIFSFTKYYPWFLPLQDIIPIWFQHLVHPGIALVSEFRMRCERIIVKVKSERPDADLKHPTLFHDIMQSKLPEADLAIERLKAEATIVLAAGTLTTSWTLTVAVFYILSSQTVIQKLKDELEAALPDRDEVVSMQVLENLPYLTAIIKESLRMSYGVSTRLARISPDKDMIYHGSPHHDGKTWIIPHGTPVSMTSALVHHDENVYPDSYTFKPDRWLENPRLEKYLLSFSKGTRQCLAINLAYAEMYLVLARLFRSFGGIMPDGKIVKSVGDTALLQLVDTTEKDVQMHADRFVPARSPNSEGVMMRIIQE